MRIFWDESGTSMTEYILVVSLVAVALIAAYCAYSNKLNSKIIKAGDDTAAYPMR